MKIEPALGSVRLDTAALSTDVAPLAAARPIVWRRLAFVAPVASATILGTALAIAATHGAPGLLRWPLIALVAANLAYLALTGVPGIIGAILHASGRKLRVAAEPTGLSRTAIVMPIHREDPRAVFTAIEVMARATAETGLRGTDFFVLSDTQDADMAAREQAEFDSLLARTPPIPGTGPTLHYRRRTENTGRKAGNLAEFCTRWGAQYEYMLVLDADSLMGAGAIARLIGLMDANPRAGIIQTIPNPVGRVTLFARMQQFAARLYTPLLVEGLTFWQQGDGNYWGHNAIIRIAPFRAHCTLPVLPGTEPWGGEILCHDVVEAGLMRGAGWDCWVLPEVLESYEALPANLVDFAARERRWCQGNLQHIGVLRHPRMRPTGRFHLAYGITHYLAAPALLLLLLLATIDAATSGGVTIAMLHGGPASAILVALAATLLYGGKLATLAAALTDRAEARRFGGRLPLLASALLEQAGAMVMSPVMIVIYARYVIELLCRRTVRWDSQARDDRGVTWSEGLRRMWLPTALGLAWAATFPALPSGLAAWALPLAAGLLLAWPATVLSSRVSLGALAARSGLLLTPEELTQPAILRAHLRAQQRPGDRGQSITTAPPRPTPAVLHLVPGRESA